MFKCTCRNVSVQVQVWKCQCVSVSVEVSVFKGFSGRTLRNAFGKKDMYGPETHPERALEPKLPLPERLLERVLCRDARFV